MEKVVNARVQHKRDTSARLTSANPVFKNGELILVDTGSGELRAKVGDGVKTYTQLPFSDEALRVLINAKGGKGETFSITLMSTDWASGLLTLRDSEFSITGYTYLVSPATKDRETYNTAEIFADDITVEGEITFHCVETPSVNIAVDILKIEVM